MAMSTMDNASAQLAIASQLHDLDELEASGTVDKLIIDMQRQQLEIDSGFDAISFEASRRLALSMAKAIEDDSALLALSTELSQIDDVTFGRLALLNHSPPISSAHHEPAQQHGCISQKVPPEAESRKRVRSLVPEDEPSSSHTAIDYAGHSDKKVRNEQITSGKHSSIQIKIGGMSSVRGPQSSKTDLSTAQTMETTPTIAIEKNPSTADCTSCSEQLLLDKLVKCPCEHYYCEDCFGQFIEASLERPDGFPPKCCKIPIAFITVADNVSAAVFSRYSARQAEIKNATALYCSIQECGVRIEENRINGVRATCVTCWRDTCTLCRSKFPRRVDGKNVGHICKKDQAREEVLALARKEGWQTCFHCGNLVALNFGCHHMRCRCKAEFCYRCGTKWRNCNCGDYDQPRLETRAIIGMDIRAARRIARGLPPDLRPREEQLAELQQRLRVDCDHNNFFYEHKTEENPGYCQICEYPGWKYILRCDGCRFTACRDCHNFFGWNGGEDPSLGSAIGSRYDDDDIDDEPVIGDESIQS